ncbi:MAG TPA: protein kinase [Pyrinomonadaceae bacterium]|nr:protein kinase [Pyrinomonadaceae bacterium]
MKALAQNTLIQNRYLVVHLIGKGGMGEVYLAVDQRLGSAVALKRTFFAGDEMLANAFEREARTLARMRHPVLPKVSDHFGEGEEQYLVMEHISGDDLAKRLEAAQKPFPVSWVMFWADQLLDALSYLHSHEPPIIHRDIKPQNLKLTDENHIILLDFGLSKTSTGQTNISSTGSTGSVVGYTPHYAPMEQIRGIGTNPRSDIYSLSATLYQLMTNVVPADALSRADTMLNGLADPIEQPHALNPEVPTAVSEVILKGMEVSQEKRFGNARDMQKALRRAFTQMQEAMSAQTVAFNVGDVLPDSEPLSSAVEKTRLIPSEPLEAAAPIESPAANAANGEIDFDATLAFDPLEKGENAKPAGIKTEVMPAPPPPPDLNGKANEVPAPPSVPLPEPDGDVQNSFVTVAAGAGSAFAEFQAPAVAVLGPKKATPKKSSGKALAIIGGLAAVLILVAGVAGAGWYFYNNYYGATAAVEPTPSPSPAPTVAATPAPSPSPTEAVAATDTNSYTNSNSNTGAVSEIGSGASQSASDSPARTDAQMPASRPNPGAPKSVSTRPPASVPKAAAKPKANTGRPDILQ